MKTQWKKLWVKATTWLVAEIILNLIGLDNLADYSEFIFDRELIMATYHPQVTVVVSSHCLQFDYGLPFDWRLFNL